MCLSFCGCTFVPINVGISDFWHSYVGRACCSSIFSNFGMNEIDNKATEWRYSQIESKTKLTNPNTSSRVQRNWVRCLTIILPILLEWITTIWIYNFLKFVLLLVLQAQTSDVSELRCSDHWDNIDVFLKRKRANSERSNPATTVTQRQKKSQRGIKTKESSCIAPASFCVRHHPHRLIEWRNSRF